MLGYLVYDNISSQAPEPPQAEVAAKENAAQEERVAKAAAQARAKMQAKLNAELTPTEESDIEAFKVEDEQLIPVGGPAPGKRPGMMPVNRPGAAPVAAQGSMGQVEQRGTTAADHVAMGKAAAARGQWSQAATAYGKALQMDPRNANLRSQRGHALYFSGKKDAAEGELRQAAAAGAVSAYRGLGHIAAEQGDNSGAVAHYQTYLKSGPRDRADIEKRIQKLTN